MRRVRSQASPLSHKNSPTHYGQTVFCSSPPCPSLSIPVKHSRHSVHAYATPAANRVCTSSPPLTSTEWDSPRQVASLRCDCFIPNKGIFINNAKMIVRKSAVLPFSGYFYREQKLTTVEATPLYNHSKKGAADAPDSRLWHSAASTLINNFNPNLFLIINYLIVL